MPRNHCTTLPALALVPALRELARLHHLPALEALATAAEGGGSVKLRASVLADKTGTSPRTVTRHLQLLADHCPSFHYRPGSGRRTTRVSLGAWRRLRRPAEHRKRKSTEARPFRPLAPRVDTGEHSWGDRRVGGKVLGVYSKNGGSQIHRGMGACPVDNPIPAFAGPQRDGTKKLGTGRKVWSRGRFGQAFRTHLRPIPAEALRPFEVEEAERQARRIAEALSSEGYGLEPGAKAAPWAPVIWTLAARLGGWDIAMRHIRAGLGSVGAGFVGWRGWRGHLARDPRKALRISFVRATAPTDCGGSWRVPTGHRAEDGDAWVPLTNELGRAWEEWKAGGVEPAPGGCVVNGWTTRGPVWSIPPPAVKTSIGPEAWKRPAVQAEARRRGERRA